MALRRKRSLSVADLPVRGKGQTKSEESGYDSDVTRKSSPRGSLKNSGGGSSNSSVKTGDDCSSSSNKDTDSVSSGSEDSGAAGAVSPSQDCKLQIFYETSVTWEKKLLVDQFGSMGI